MRLIDADWLLDVVENIIDWDTERDRNRIIHQVRELTPTVDAEPHWIPVTKEELFKAGYEGKEIRFRVDGRLFAIRELAQ